MKNIEIKQFSLIKLYKSYCLQYGLHYVRGGWDRMLCTLDISRPFFCRLMNRKMRRSPSVRAEQMLTHWPQDKMTIFSWTKTDDYYMMLVSRYPLVSKSSAGQVMAWPSSELMLSYLTDAHIYVTRSQWVNIWIMINGQTESVYKHVIFEVFGKFLATILS